MVDLRLGDCLEILPTLADGSVDMVLCDLPYGTTACKWDSVIPFEPLWAEYRRVCKPNAAIVLTASQPFTSALVMSNPKSFRYDWAWDKINRKTGHLNANKMPLRQHETVLVFYERLPVFNKQMIPRPPKSGGQSLRHGEYTGRDGYAHTPRRFPSETNPVSVLSIPAALANDNGHHPTQKPVALMEYLIRTYTNEGETVLDNTMGSGTTGVACRNTGRRFIGIERDPGYFAIAEQRIHSGQVAAKAHPAANDNAQAAPDLFSEVV